MIVQRELTASEVDSLRDMHRALLRADVATARLEGDYAPRACLVSTGTTRPVHWFRDGSLRGPADMLSADNVANIRRHGIAVFGPPAASVLPPVTADEVRAAVRAMMAKEPDAASETVAAREILDLARSLCALETGEPTSHLAGLEWGLRAMDQRWRPILRRAADVRARAHVDETDRTLRDALAALRATLGLT